MKRDVVLRTSIDKSLKEGMISITVSMDKEMLEKLTKSYNKVLESGVGNFECINLVAEILCSVEEGCKK